MIDPRPLKLVIHIQVALSQRRGVGFDVENQDALLWVGGREVVGEQRAHCEEGVEVRVEGVADVARDVVGGGGGLRVPTGLGRRRSGRAGVASPHAAGALWASSLGW